MPPLDLRRILAEVIDDRAKAFPVGAAPLPLCEMGVQGWNVIRGDMPFLVGCGISHPCTTFDKWSLLVEVDDEYNVIGGLRTFF